MITALKGNDTMPCTSISIASPRRIRSLEHSARHSYSPRLLWQIVLRMGTVKANSFSSVENSFRSRPSTSGMLDMSKYTRISSIRSTPHKSPRMRLGLSRTPRHFASCSAYCWLGSLLISIKR